MQIKKRVLKKNYVKSLKTLRTIINLEKKCTLAIESFSLRNAKTAKWRMRWPIRRWDRFLDHVYEMWVKVLHELVKPNKFYQSALTPGSHRGIQHKRNGGCTSRDFKVLVGKTGGCENKCGIFLFFGWRSWILERKKVLMRLGSNLGQTTEQRTPAYLEFTQ